MCLCVMVAFKSAAKLLQFSLKAKKSSKNVCFKDKVNKKVFIYDYKNGREKGFLRF